MVKNFARSTGKKFPAINDPVTFRDQGQIASWAKESVALCQRADILNGDAESGRFRPGERATRAEAASIVYKYIENTEFDGYTIIQKRISNVAVRAVVFLPVRLHPQPGPWPEHGGWPGGRNFFGQAHRGPPLR